MLRLAIIAGILTFSDLASFGQIARPDLSLPPCSGEHCLAHPRGALVPHPADQRRACPSGTVYDAYKGACRVVPGMR